MSFILPGGHDIPTHAGDVAMFESVDSAAARWRLIGYVSARTTPRARSYVDETRRIAILAYRNARGDR